MINRVVLVGRITRDPEIRYSTGNNPFVGFTLACNRAYVDRNGNRQENTDFINCIVWGRIAETVAKYVKKGALLGVEGRIQSRTVEDNGVNRTVMEVNAESVQFLDSRSSGDNQQNNYQQRNDGYQNNNYQQNNYQQQNNYNQGYQQNNYQQRQSNQQNDVFSNKTMDVAEDDLPF